MLRLPRLCLLSACALAGAMLPAPIRSLRAQGFDTAAAACPAPAWVQHPPHALPATGAALAAHQPIAVLAVGSALQGAHVGPEASLPARTLERLRAQAPGIPIDLQLSSEPGTTAADALGTLRRALRGRTPPTLILWQTGTLDAARHTPPDAFARALADGVRLARDAGIDLVLIDPLYSRLLDGRADLGPYEAALEEAGTAPGADLFGRHALMRAWVEQGVIDLEATSRTDRRRTLIRLHDCLAAALSSQILAGAQAAQQSARQP